MNAGRLCIRQVISLALLFLGPQLALSDDESKTVLGPRNMHLYDGSQALMAGDGEKGVRLTLLGLKSAQGIRETKVAHSNLCAGYTMIDNPEEALLHCDWVLERYPDHWRTYINRAIVYLKLGRYEDSEADIQRGQALRPGSEKLKILKGMLLDETHPVTPKIEIDDRRRDVQEDAGDEESDGSRN